MSHYPVAVTALLIQNLCFLSYSISNLNMDVVELHAHGQAILQPQKFSPLKTCKNTNCTGLYRFFHNKVLFAANLVGERSNFGRRFTERSENSREDR